MDVRFLVQQRSNNHETDSVDVFLLTTHGIHFTYHAYHESAFGIYRKDGALPDPATANTDLINLFTERLQ